MRAILATPLFAAGIGLLGTLGLWLPGVGMSSIIPAAQAATVRTPGLQVTDCQYHQNSGEITCKVGIKAPSKVERTTPVFQVTDCVYHQNSGELTCKVVTRPTP
jgi:hypothetical protein